MEKFQGFSLFEVIIAISLLLLCNQLIFQSFYSCQTAIHKHQLHHQAIMLLNRLSEISLAQVSLEMPKPFQVEKIPIKLGTKLILHWTYPPNKMNTVERVIRYPK